MVKQACFFFVGVTRFRSNTGACFTLCKLHQEPGLKKWTQAKCWVLIYVGLATVLDIINQIKMRTVLMQFHQALRLGVRFMNTLQGLWIFYPAIWYTLPINTTREDTGNVLFYHTNNWTKNGTCQPYRLILLILCFVILANQQKLRMSVKTKTKLEIGSYQISCQRLTNIAPEQAAFLPGIQVW